METFFKNLMSKNTSLQGWLLASGISWRLQKEPGQEGDTQILNSEVCAVGGACDCPGRAREVGGQVGGTLQAWSWRQDGEHCLLYGNTSALHCSPSVQGGHQSEPPLTCSAQYSGP